MAVSLSEQPRTGWFPNAAQLAKDLPASLVVFLIAVPLSLGIALASGAPIMAGVTAAIIGGIIVGLLGGAPLQVSGPAAGLTAIVFAYTQQLGWPAMCVAIIGAGLLQILLGSVRVARICLAVSPAVVHGMLAGIGVTIVLSQLHIVLGGTPESHALINLRELPDQIIHMHTPATFLGLATIGLLLLWQQPFMPARLRAIPGSLIAVVTMTVVSVLLHLNVARIDLHGGLTNEFHLPALPAASAWGTVTAAAITLALVASVESLLSAVATDRMHNGQRADLDRELIGQGVANTISGLLGGLPVTGVIVRSSANIRAGAQTRWSSVLHGLWVLVAAAVGVALLQSIPLAVLAGLLVFVGLQLVNVHHIKSVLTHREAAIYFVTVGGVVCLNLLEGVAVGIALAVFLLLRRLSVTKISVTENPAMSRWHVRIDGSLTFLSVPNLTRELAHVPSGATVDVDLMVDFLDQAAFEALHNWRLGHERTGGQVDIDEMHERWYQAASQGDPRREKAGLSQAASRLLARRRRDIKPLATGNPETNGTHPEQLLQGVQAYQRSEASAVRSILFELAEGQQPTELFITCADSRLVPTLFTSSGPGDLFTVRNVGNLVPPCRTQPDGSAADADENEIGAAVEYAVGVLNVGSIVVCGHSGCGAMKAILHPSDRPQDTPHLSAWLQHGQAARSRVQWEGGDSERPQVDRLAMANVILQMEHLRSYPIVREREASGRLRLVGMFFDIPTASVLLYDRGRGIFAAVTDETDVRVPVAA